MPRVILVGSHLDRIKDTQNGRFSRKQLNLLRQKQAGGYRHCEIQSIFLIPDITMIAQYLETGDLDAAMAIFNHPTVTTVTLSEVLTTTSENTRLTAQVLSVKKPKPKKFLIDEISMHNRIYTCLYPSCFPPPRCATTSINVQVAPFIWPDPTHGIYL